MVIAMVTGDEGEGAMFRKSTTITAVGAALVLALPATALSQSSDGPVKFDPQAATQAQVLRGQALGRYYQGQGTKVDPATEAQILRGQALGRYYQGLQNDAATQAQILRGQALGRYYESTNVAM